MRFELLGFCERLSRSRLPLVFEPESLVAAWASPPPAATYWWGAMGIEAGLGRAPFTGCGRGVGEIELMGGARP